MTNSKLQELLSEFGGKYENQNFISKYLIDSFYREIRAVIASFPETYSLLEIGCGIGESSLQIAKGLGCRTLEVSEFEDEMVHHLKSNNFPLRICQESVYELNRLDSSFDCVLLLEVLEHLDNPEAALAEIFRVSKQDVIISVPNEPLWRVLNFCRGKYWSDWGNTPGHINHWSSNSLVELLSKYGKIKKLVKTTPWLIVHLDSRNSSANALDS